MRLTLGIAALAATLAAATPASAQLFTATAEAEARGVVLTAQSLTRDRDLDFGIITVNPSGAGGTVTISSTNAGLRTTSSPADVTLLASTFSSARFMGYGAPNQTVTLTLTQPGNLVGPNAASIPATLSLNDAGPFVLDSTGRWESYVGGVFTIAATQAAGLYTANFELTADFN